MDLFVSVNSVKLVSLSIFQPNIKEKYLGGSPGLMVMGRELVCVVYVDDKF